MAPITSGQLEKKRVREVSELAETGLTLEASNWWLRGPGAQNLDWGGQVVFPSFQFLPAGRKKSGLGETGNTRSGAK